MAQIRVSTYLVAAAFIVFASGVTSARAAEPDEVTADTGGRVYELHDTDTDTPPVNYRSNEDERYNTPAQHDAEMFAEQYEHERQLKAIEDQQRLQDMNGFAAGAQYTPGRSNSNYR